MNNFMMRTITGLAMVFILLFSLSYTYWLFAGIFLAVVILGLWEFYTIFSSEYANPQKIYGILAGSLLYLALVSSNRIEIIPAFRGYGLPSALSLVIFFLSFIIEIYRKQRYPLINVATTMAGIFYIALPLGLMNALNSPSSVHFHGFPALLLGYFILTWFYDTGAYLYGRPFGKHSFFERISPKKTWEGTIAGCFVAVLTAIGFGFLVPEILIADWLSLAVLIIIFGNFGDLAESLFKRSLNIKDSGNILPGHGGILDRFDTIFMSAPFVFLYCILRNLI